MAACHLFALKRKVASLRAVLADHGFVFVGLKEGLNVLIILILQSLAGRYALLLRTQVLCSFH